MSDRQISLFALLQAFVMALILLGLGTLRRHGGFSWLDAAAFAVEFAFFFFLNRFLYRSMRERYRRELEQRHGGDRASLEAEHRGLAGFWRRMTSGPRFPGSRGFLLAMLLPGLALLTLGLLGLARGHLYLPFLTLTTLGLGNVSVGTGETLPERRRELAVVLRMLSFLVLLVFMALVLARVLGLVV